MSTSLFVFARPVWWRPSVSNYSCCGFIITVAGSCLKHSSFPCLLAVTLFLLLFYKLPWALEGVMYDLFRAELSPSLCLGTEQPWVFEGTTIYCKLASKCFFSVSLSSVHWNLFLTQRWHIISSEKALWWASLFYSQPILEHLAASHLGWHKTRGICPPVIPTHVLHMQNWQEVTQGSVSLCTLTEIWVLSIPPQKGPQRRTPFI